VIEESAVESICETGGVKAGNWECLCDGVMDDESGKSNKRSDINRKRQARDRETGMMLTVRSR